MANRKRDVAKERAWRRWISRQRKSGLSVRAFCAREQLSEPSFHAWRRTLAERQADRQPTRTTRKKRNVPPAFVSLTTPAPPRADLFQPAAAVELVHRDGHVLRIAAGCDRGTLLTVLSALATEDQREARFSC